MNRAAAAPLVLVPLVAALAFGASATACDGAESTSSYGEPLRVRGAQFVRGPLPGSPPAALPPAGDAGDGAGTNAGGDAGAAGPLTITGIVTLNPIVYPGEANKQIAGRATKDAAAIALRFDDLGSGYWVLPVGAPDPLYPGELTWTASSDFNLHVAAGRHPLRVVAVDAQGRAGTQSEQLFCLASTVPDNLHACFPDQKTVPEAVFALSWDEDVDLDLHVISPEGREIDPKHPLAVPVDAGARPAANASAIDRDSLAGCVSDGQRRENFVFTRRPRGTWSISVNLFDACKKASVRFSVVAYEADGAGPDRHLVETYRTSGRLVAEDANGGAGPGLFAFEYPFD